MKIKLFFLAALALIAASCAKNEADMPQPIAQQGRTVTVSVPEEGAQTRTTLEQDGKNIIVKWKTGDVINLYFKQETKLVGVNNIALNIVPGTNDKKATFDIPATVTGIDLNQPYTLYGVHGTSFSIFDNKININVNRKFTADLATFNVPMYFKTDVPAGGNVGTVTFQHLGCIQAVHVTNKSSSAKTFKTCFPVAATATTSQPYTDMWAYFHSHKNFYYNVETNAVRETDTSPGYMSDVNVPPGETKTFYSWTMPNGNAVPRIKPGVITGLVEQLYDSFLPERPALQKGNAYHLYAEWDGANLKFVGQLTHITITATLPNDEHLPYVPRTFGGWTSPGGDILKWVKDDKLKLNFNRSLNYYQVDASIVNSSISADGKTANFIAIIPSEIPVNTVFYLSGVYQRTKAEWSPIDHLDGSFNAGSNTYRLGLYEEDFIFSLDKLGSDQKYIIRPMLYFSGLNLLCTGSPLAITVNMQHTGWIVALHLKNTSGAEIDLPKDGKLEEHWENPMFAWNGHQAHEPVDFNCTTGEFFSKPLLGYISFQQCIYFTINLGASPLYGQKLANGASITFYRWVASKANIPKLKARFKLSNDVIKETPYMPAKTVGNGKVYHVYTKWDGTNLTLGD